MSFRRVTSFSQLWRGEMAAHFVDGANVLLVRVVDTVFAYENRCAHLGLPFTDGALDGEVLTCGAHHYQYEACSGKGINPRTVCLRTYAVKVEGDAVLVDVTQPAGGSA